jgi:hypothetical protein
MVDITLGIRTNQTDNRLCCGQNRGW